MNEEIEKLLTEFFEKKGYWVRNISLEGQIVEDPKNTQIDYKSRILIRIIKK